MLLPESKTGVRNEKRTIMMSIVALMTIGIFLFIYSSLSQMLALEFCPLQMPTFNKMPNIDKTSGRGKRPFLVYWTASETRCSGFTYNSSFSTEISEQIEVEWNHVINEVQQVYFKELSWVGNLSGIRSSENEEHCKKDGCRSSDGE